MSSYTGTANRPERAKAIIAVAAVHAGLAAIIVAGLNVSVVSQAFDRMTTINLREPPPPPPPQPPPKPQPRQQAMKKPQGAPAPKAEPTPVVAPPTPLPVKSPIAAAKVAGTGAAPSSGAGAAGNGTGAGGAGNGPGGGGMDYSRFTPARRITRIPNSEYRMLAATGISSGTVGVTVRVNPDGSPSNCRVARSSGDGSIDSLMCQLTLRYVRFDPARDPNGRPVAEDITFFPNWFRP